MSTAPLIWQELRDDRGFQRSNHCVSGGEKVEEFLKGWHREFRADVGTLDFVDKTQCQNCDRIVLTALSYYKLLKHLEPKNIYATVQHLLRQIQACLYYGTVHSDVQVQELSARDPHYNLSAKLKKQYGCFATNEIEPETVIGQYVGEMKFEPCDCDSPTSIHRDDANTSFTLVDVDGAGEIYLDASEFGNEMVFINDFRQIHGENSQCLADKAIQNVIYIQVTANGCPCIFVVTIAKIAQRQQLLAEYGNRFWNEESASSEMSWTNPNSKTRACTRNKRSGFYLLAEISQKLPSMLEIQQLWNRLDDPSFTKGFELDFALRRPSHRPPLPYISDHGDLSTTRHIDARGFFKPFRMSALPSLSLPVTRSRMGPSKVDKKRDLSTPVVSPLCDSGVGSGTAGPASPDEAAKAEESVDVKQGSWDGEERNGEGEEREGAQGRRIHPHASRFIKGRGRPSRSTMSGRRSPSLPRPLPAQLPAGMAKPASSLPCSAGGDAPDAVGRGGGEGTCRRGGKGNSGSGDSGGTADAAVCGIGGAEEGERNGDSTGFELLDVACGSSDHVNGHVYEQNGNLLGHRTGGGWEKACGGLRGGGEEGGSGAGRGAATELEDTSELEDYLLKRMMGNTEVEHAIIAAAELDVEHVVSSMGSANDAAPGQSRTLPPAKARSVAAGASTGSTCSAGSDLAPAVDGGEADEVAAPKLRRALDHLNRYKRPRLHTDTIGDKPDLSAQARDMEQGLSGAAASPQSASKRLQCAADKPLREVESAPDLPHLSGRCATTAMAGGSGSGGGGGREERFAGASDDGSGDTRIVCVPVAAANHDTPRPIVAEPKPCSVHAVEGLVASAADWERAAKLAADAQTAMDCHAMTRKKTNDDAAALVRAMAARDLTITKLEKIESLICVIAASEDSFLAELRIRKEAFQQELLRDELEVSFAVRLLSEDIRCIRSSSAMSLVVPRASLSDRVEGGDGGRIAHGGSMEVTQATPMLAAGEVHRSSADARKATEVGTGGVVLNHKALLDEWRTLDQELDKSNDRFSKVKKVLYEVGPGHNRIVSKNAVRDPSIRISPATAVIANGPNDRPLSIENQVVNIAVAAVGLGVVVPESLGPQRLAHTHLVIRSPLEGHTLSSRCRKADGLPEEGNDSALAAKDIVDCPSVCAQAGLLLHNNNDSGRDASWEGSPIYTTHPPVGQKRRSVAELSAPSQLADSDWLGSTHSIDPIWQWVSKGAGRETGQPSSTTQGRIHCQSGYALSAAHSMARPGAVSAGPGYQMAFTDQPITPTLAHSVNESRPDNVRRRAYIGLDTVPAQSPSLCNQREALADVRYAAPDWQRQSRQKIDFAAVAGLDPASVFQMGAYGATEDDDTGDGSLPGGMDLANHYSAKQRPENMAPLKAVQGSKKNQLGGGSSGRLRVGGDRGGRGGRGGGEMAFLEQCYKDLIWGTIKCVATMMQDHDAAGLPPSQGGNLRISIPNLSRRSHDDVSHLLEGLWPEASQRRCVEPYLRYLNQIDLLSVIQVSPCWDTAPALYIDKIVWHSVYRRSFLDFLMSCAQRPGAVHDMQNPDQQKPIARNLLCGKHGDLYRYLALATSFEMLYVLYVQGNNRYIEALAQVLRSMLRYNVASRNAMEKIIQQHYRAGRFTYQVAEVMWKRMLY